MRKGFTLIELSIVLVIIGLIIGMGLDFAGPMLEKSRRDEDRAKMRTIENALLTYLKTHGKIPCPARRDLITSNSSFGASTDCSAVAPTGTTDVSPEGIRIGVVPVRELNLPPTYMFDSYKNRITYVAIKGLAQTNTLYDSYTTAGVAPDTDGVGGGDTDGIITVVDTNGTQITNVHNKIIVPYVLVSHGKDGLGSYKKTGLANAACDASHKDGANCDNNNTFREVEYLDVTGSNYFDDVIRWKTKDRMEVEADKLSITTGTGFPACAEGQVMQYTSGAWACAALSGNGILGAKYTSYTPSAAQVLTDSYADVAGMSVTYTPKSATTNIMVTFNFHAANSGTASSYRYHVKLVRDGFDVSNAIQTESSGDAVAAESRKSVSFIVPSNATTATTLKIQARRYNSANQTSVHQLRYLNGASAISQYPQASVILMELE